MDLKIVGAREFALRKSLFKRTVVTETRRDMSPFRDQGFIGCAARDVSADGHRSESAAVIALAAGENAVTILLAAFEGKLAREVYRRFAGSGAAGSEVDSSAFTEIRRSHREQALGKFFRRSGMKLRGVREGDLRRLLGHGAADFRNTVTNVDDCGLPGSVEKTAAIGRNDPATFPARDNRKGLLEIAGEKSAARRHEMPGKGL